MAQTNHQICVTLPIILETQEPQVDNNENSRLVPLEGLDWKKNTDTKCF